MDKILDFFRNTKHRIKKTIDYFYSPIIFSVLSPIITLIIFTFIFSQNNVYPFGDTSVAWCDLKQQGIPLLMNLKDILSGEGSILYSFNNASGMNFWGVFLFFLSNPFSFLCVFFEKGDIYKLVNLLMILKFCLASFTATLFFLKSNKKLSYLVASALGVSYALCAYGLMYFQNLMWLDLMYLYPLLALSIERIISQKGYGFYTVILTLCVLFNFYLSYMVVVALLLIIGLYIIISKHSKNKKRKICLDFFKGSLLAAMISAVSWLPAFIQYSKSGRGENIVETLATSGWLTNKNTVYLLLLSSTIIFIGFLALMKPNRKKVGTFIAFILFTLPIFIEPINKMWHTGSYMAFPGRYAFITVFSGLELVALALEKQEEELKPSVFDTLPRYAKQIIYVATTVLFGFIICFLFKDIVCKFYNENKELFFAFTNSLWANKKQFNTTFKVAVVFAVIYLVSTLLYKLKAVPKYVFSIFLTFVVICEGCFAINVYAITITERDIFDEYELFLDLEDRIDDDSFFRIKTEHKYQDSNLLGALGYNSIGHYTSLTDLEYMSTSKALGYSSSWMELSTYGGTELSDAILGVKYNVINKKLENSVYTNGKYSIVETFGALGLGVKYSSDDDLFSYDDFERTEFQEKIFSALFGTEEKLFQNYLPFDIERCTITEKDNKTIINGEGEIFYSIEVGESQTLYFDAFGEFSNNLRQEINKGFTVYVNEKRIATYPDGMYTGFMKLGTFENETVEVRVVVNNNTTELLSYGVCGLKLNVLKTALENKESGYLNAEDNKVWGKVTASAGEKLFISVPYNDGFKVKLNGKTVEAQKVFGDFYSIDLVDGENVIEMKYTPSGLIWGIFICIIGIALSIVFKLSTMKKRKTISNADEAENEFAKRNALFSYSFIVLFTLVFLVIYIIPVLIKAFG